MPLARVVAVVPADEGVEAFLRETKVSVRDVYVLEVIEVIRLLSLRFKNSDIASVGASSCTILHEPRIHLTFYRALKTGVVFLILFFGGAMAIMNFHADVGMGQVLCNIVDFYAGAGGDVMWASVAYSAGIGAGFLFVLNLFKPRSDQTPSLLDLDLHDYDTQKQRYMAEKNKK